MEEKIKDRLSELKREFEAGQAMLAELQTKQATLKETLLRISGAIQVLEEIMVTPAQAPSVDTGTVATP